MKSPRKKAVPSKPRAKKRSQGSPIGARKGGRPDPSSKWPPDRELKGRGFPIVGVGASAGGLEAFTDLLRSLPADTGMSLVLVQHLDPKHASMLADILSHASKMPVLEVKPATRVRRDHVYVIPSGKAMIIREGVLQLSSRSQSAGQFRPIDQFLRSLAEDQKDRAIGVILSGGATDGTLGLEEIKAAGGITFAQDATAQHDSMPRSAIAAGCVDFVMAPQGIAQELMRIAQHPYLLPNARPAVARDEDLRKLLDLLRRTTGVDFANYKRNTLMRRIARRMLLHKHEGLADYTRLVQSTPTELQALYQDILISVTSFFRNPEAFEALRKKVFPKLIKNRSSDDPIRIWVLGCSTGEEAYSIAIAVSEYLEEKTRPQVRVQIFASDLNVQLIDKARAGVYSKNIAQDVSLERLRRWFIEIDGGYRVIKALRDMVVFAQHNSLTDPPFSHMDFISSRNLLIYLEPVLQQRLVRAMHYALEPGGTLWLGSSESVGTSKDLFDIGDAKHKFYVRKAGPSSLLGLVGPRSVVGSTQQPPGASARRNGAKTGAADGLSEADRLLLTRYAPPGVLITDDFSIVQFRGETGAFLSPAPGKASLNLIKMAREGLGIAIRNAVNKAKRTHAPVREEGVRVRSNGGFRTVHVAVLPVPSGSAEGYLVLFERATATAGGSRAKGSPRAEGSKRQRDVTRVQEELEATRDYLQSVIEQKEAANEELQAANEEAQSANEELQSVNEELETSKEEIQSSSEELATVNDELNHRNVELSQTNNDLINLISSVHMAIVFVGRDLRIRRFSASAEKMFNLIAGDLGRPIVDISPRVGVRDLERMLLKAIDTIQLVEQEVQDAQGRWYALRIRPYRTMENKIDGAVLVLVDIDALKQSELVMRRQAALLERTHEPIVVWELTGRITYWNKAAEEMYGYSGGAALGMLRGEVMRSDVPAAVFVEALKRDGQWSGELVQQLSNGSQIVVECRMWLVQDEDGALVVETHHAITERKMLERALRTRANELALVDLRKNEFLAMLAHELRNPLASLGSALRVVEHGIPAQGLASDSLRVMNRQLRNLSRLVDDLIDIARVTQKKIQLKTADLELRQLLTNVAEDARHVLDSRGQQLDVSLGDQSLYVAGDSTRLEQVFNNLIGNASKFSEPGSRISLTLGVQEKSAIVTVADSGIGIPATELPIIFDLFVQGDPSTRRAVGGLGIGLTLSRELLMLHGASITAHSAGRNAGSEFIVRLPLIDVPLRGRRTKSKGPNLSEEVRRVLVVDDNPDAAGMLATVLRLAGLEVEAVTSAAAALDVVTQFAPDAVVLDIGMPDVDGYQLARKLTGLKRAPKLLIALSGYGQKDDLEKASAAGFQHHLTKPADLDRLLELLGRSNGKQTQADD